MIPVRNQSPSPNQELNKRKFDQVVSPEDAAHALKQRFTEIGKVSGLGKRSMTKNTKAICLHFPQIIQSVSAEIGMTDTEMARVILGMIKEECKDKPYETLTNSILKPANVFGAAVKYLETATTPNTPANREAIGSSQAINIQHLEKMTATGGGFHFCPADDEKWVQAQDVYVSPQGAAYASLPTPKDPTRIKTSSIFNPDFDKATLLDAILNRSEVLGLYRPLQSDLLLRAAKTDRGHHICFETQTNTKNPAIAESAYPIYLFFVFQEVDSTAEIQISLPKKIGANTATEKNIPYSEFSEHVKNTKEEILSKIISEDRMPSTARYLNKGKKTLVIDITSKLGMPNMRKGIYVEIDLEEEEFLLIQDFLARKKESNTSLKTGSSDTSSARSTPNISIKGTVSSQSMKTDPDESTNPPKIMDPRFLSDENENGIEI
ncbi:MAG: hypothetical protein K2Y01_07075 [Rhabdochlamydiaceae bacterium]|nr:hypothetical protein [Rhabdochlamydiaceae bacterium]